MISKPNNDNASTVAGSNARFSLLGLLLLSVGLLLSIFHPAVAAPGKAAPAPVPYRAFTSYSYTIKKNYSVAPSGLDSVDIAVSPSVPDGTELYVSLNGSTSLQSAVVIGDTARIALSSPTAGTVTVAVYAVLPAVSPVVSATVNFIAQPLPPDPANSYFVVVTNGADADGVSQNSVEAFLYDQYGNPVGPTYNATITWAVTGSASYVGTATNVAVNSNGTETIALTDATPQTVNSTGVVTYTDPATHLPVTFNLQDQSTPPLSYLPVTFVQPQPNTATSYIAPVITPMPADGTSQDEVQATVYDNSGAPYNGPITFTILSGTATPVTVSTTVVNGVATAYYTSTTVGSVEVQAQVTVGTTPTMLYLQGSTSIQYATIVFNNPPPNIANSYITPVITPMSADGTSQDEVEVYLVSSTGQPLIGANVVFSVLSPGTATMVQSNPVPTNGQGFAYMYLTNTNVESDDIQATYTDPNTNITYTLNDKVNASQPYSIVQFVVGPVDPSKSYIVVSQNNATADGTSQDIVTAYLFDAQGRPITGATLNWSISPTGPTLSQPASTTNVYTADYVSTAVGAFQVSLTANGVTIDAQGTTNTSVTINFVTGQPVTGDPGGPSDGGDPGGGNPSNGGNPPNNGGGTTGGGGSTGGGTNPGGGNNTSPTDNNGYTLLYIPTADNYQLANGKAQDSVMCLVTDAEKHPISGEEVTFFIQTSPTEGSITSGAQWTITPVNVLTGPDGIARIALTSTEPGTVFVDATIPDPTSGNPVLVAGSYEVAVFETEPDTTNPQTALSVIVGEANADGIQQNVVKAHVVDLNGNVMTNQPVYFVVDSGSGTIITPQPVMTDANGDAFIEITSKTVGYVLITATVDNEHIIFGSPARVYFAAINIYVPRAFSPNGDGVNDILKPILVGIQTFHYFNIYNRWGNLIFTTQDPNQGWDGTFKGVAQPTETYLWIAEGIDENGRKVVQKGMTSLVR